MAHRWRRSRWTRSHLAPGISRSTFYLYFADKGELLALATNWLKDQLFELRVDPQSDGSLDDLPSYIAALERIIGRYRDHAALLAAVNYAIQFDDRVAEQWTGAQDRYIAWVAGILRTEQERGLTDDSFDAVRRQTSSSTEASRSSPPTSSAGTRIKTAPSRANWAPLSGTDSSADGPESCRCRWSRVP